MNFNPDDPKYTAYVLGELSDADRAAVDAELHADPRVAAFIAEIQTMTQSLAMELRTEALPTLAKNQREEILAAANTPIVATAVQWQTWSTDRVDHGHFRVVIARRRQRMGASWLEHRQCQSKRVEQQLKATRRGSEKLRG